MVYTSALEQMQGIITRGLSPALVLRGLHSKLLCSGPPKLSCVTPLLLSGVQRAEVKYAQSNLTENMILLVRPILCFSRQKENLLASC
jgi:hypothetical protein